MKVIWLPQARKEVRHIGTYIRRQFGQVSYEKFKQEIRETSRLLGANPYMGILEPLLAERSVTYHSFVMNELNKIIYFIKDDHIHPIPIKIRPILTSISLYFVPLRPRLRPRPEGTTSY